ncbi:hydrolase 2, exosortase A system-associated [Lentisalinibacter salinarum]|uniref:hydrolase 2, exosortase A system-associated n=1 Tax=Lentisalinibacter salinarum TaxID=2992239 RepID=UPI003863FF47
MITSQQVVCDPFFADTGRGRRFAIASRPRTESRGGILFLPPFAEEMNKSRRMASLTARALAQEGWHVLRFDLFGCGDSDGESGEATWAGWIDDVSFWCEWLRQRSNGPIVLWGLRAGALLASAWLQQQEDSLPLLMWQPVTNGEQYLTQFLRLRAAAEMLDAREARGSVSALKADLSAGKPVTVAGYTLHPDLANGLAEARFVPPGHHDATLIVLNVVPNANSAPPPALEKAVRTWANAGSDVLSEQIAGPGFWRTTEIETIPSLVDASVRQTRRLAR